MKNYAFPQSCRDAHAATESDRLLLLLGFTAKNNLCPSASPYFLETGTSMAFFALPGMVKM
ncbi:MAG: hypothetical protein N2235_21110 [Fischerella sp.]|nr:hypothetical protein [Fischerella sp.]